MNPVAEKPTNQAPSSEPSQPPRKRTFFKGIGNMLGVQVVKAPIDTTRPEAQAQPTGEFGVQVKPAGEVNSQIGEVAPVATPAESTEIPVTAAEAELKQSEAPTPAQTAPVENEVVVVPSVAPEVPKDETSVAPTVEPVIVPAQEEVTEQPSVATTEPPATTVPEVQPPVQSEVSNSSFIAADASYGRQRTRTSLTEQELTSEEAIQPEEKLDNHTVEPDPATEPIIPLNTNEQVAQGVEEMKELDIEGDIPKGDDKLAQLVLMTDLQGVIKPDGHIDEEELNKRKLVFLDDPANESKIREIDSKLANTVADIKRYGLKVSDAGIVRQLFPPKSQDQKAA